MAFNLRNALRLPGPAGWLAERLRSPITHSALRHVSRRRGTFASAREDLLWRIDRMGDCRLDTPRRMAAFDDVVAAFCPSGFEFRPVYSECAVVPDNGGAIRLTGDLWSAGSQAASIERILHVRGRVANHEFLRAHGDFQGAALAPLIVRQSFLFFDRIGIETAIVHAGLETGVYYWARCGFDFVKEEERQHVRAWFSLMLDALDLGIGLDDDLQAAYQLVTSAKTPTSAYRWRRLSTPFPMATRTRRSESTSRGLPKAME